MRLAIVFGAYVLTARAGLLLDAVSGFATLVWAPTGIALAATLWWGNAIWPAVALGAATANLLVGAPLPVALGIAAGNTGEALVGASLLRASGFDARLQRLRDVIGLTVFGAFGSTLISATVGVIALRLGGLSHAGTTGATWLAWWTGDLMGNLVVAPALLVLGARPPPKARRFFAVEALVSVLAVAATMSSVFANRRTVLELRVPAYLLFPVLLAVVMRFPQYGAALANLFVAAAAIAFTTLGYGPFVRTGGLSQNLLQLQMFMGVLSTTALLLGAAISERDQATQAREDFLSVASHELRTPLTALNLQLQILGQRAGGERALSPERLASVVQAALRQSRRLSRLVNNLLDISRIRAERLELAPEEFDLAELAREVAGTYEDAGPSRISVGSEGDCRGRWDRQGLEQVMDNLISNALKYGEGKPVDVAVVGRGDGVELTVRDGGIGVAPADQRRIFDRFERAVSSRRFGGLGLGLWITRRIVEEHRGRIRVESEPGHGSTFIVELARAPFGGRE